MDHRLVIIIPALNEEATIAEVIQRCQNVPLPEVCSREVVVVDDGSTDETASIARGLGAIEVSHPVNRGVGLAFQSGLRKALELGATLIVNIDADGQFNPDNIPSLLQPIFSDKADFTTASRFKDPELIPVMPGIKIWGNRVMSRLICKISRQKFYDVSCGFRAYSREAALQLNLWGEFTYTQESILDLVVKGMRLVEVPMKIRGVRSAGKSRVASNLFKYGYRAAIIILNTYRDFWPMYFFGWISLMCFLPGVSLVVFLLIHYVVKGSFSPHLWAGFTGGALVFLALVTLITGVMAQMLKRIRLNQEMMLFYHKSRHYSDAD